MGHNIRIFVGAPVALEQFRQIAPDLKLYALTPEADLAVLPLDEDLHDRLHDRFGTGDWPEAQAVLLSTTDQSFAADCSTRAPLAYIQTDYFGGNGSQSAVLWQVGQMVVAPTTLDNTQRAQRPASLWPINVVLRALGIRATGKDDEFATFGLTHYRSNDAIHDRALPLRR